MIARRRTGSPPKNIDSTKIPRLARAGDLHLEARRLMQGLLGGRHQTRDLGASVDFADHRAYLPGDDLRQIDWRAYARSDHLLVKRFYDERSLPLTLAIDCTASMQYGKPSKLSRAQLTSAMLGLLALDQGDQVHIASIGDRLRVMPHRFGGIGSGHDMCETLAKLPMSKQTKLARCCRELRQHLRRRSLVVICADLMCPLEETAEALAALHGFGHELVVLQFLDHTELDLPADWGRVLLRDPENSDSQQNIHADQARATYRHAIHEHLAACRRLCAAGKAEHLLISSDQQLVATVGAWLRRRRLGRGR